MCEMTNNGDEYCVHLYYRVSPREKGTYTCGRGRDNVDFGRLMALDYQREWLEQRERKQQQQREKLKVSQPMCLE